jgi:hypothetical protein
MARWASDTEGGIVLSRRITFCTLLAILTAGTAESQTLPTVKVPEAVIKEREGLAKTPPDSQPPETWCNPRNGFALCQADTSIKHAGAKEFWSQGDPSGFTALKMLNIQGLGDKSQSVYTELLSDLWGTWRIGLAGVFTPKDTTSPEGKALADKSKAQQFLNGGGPAVATLARPLAAWNRGGLRSVAIFKLQSAFNAPGTNGAISDSTKYSDIGVDVQSRIDGLDNKIGGIATFHAGQVFGGRAFYNGFGEKQSFSVAHFSIGLVVENSVRVSWTKLVLGPSKLIDQQDLITVNFVR